MLANHRRVWPESSRELTSHLTLRHATTRMNVFSWFLTVWCVGGVSQDESFDFVQILAIMAIGVLMLCGGAFWDAFAPVLHAKTKAAALASKQITNESLSKIKRK